MTDTHLIFGMHAVQAALRHEPDTIKTVWMEHARRDKRAREIEQLARQHAIPVQRVERQELDQMAAGGRHQGILAEARLQPALNEAALKTLLAEMQVPPFLLILDGVQDPHNLGACLRTADAAGVHAVIAPRDKACGLTSTVRKVACGAAEIVPFVQVTNLARTLKTLQQAGIWIIGTDLDATESLFETDLSGPLALVLGAEGKGLRRLTREACDTLVKLPMHGTVQSLNVSVSAGICLYEALRQRRRQAND
jgi:23S rRNA (guanosine2251-2'-O)-methyltransferase